MEFLIFWVIFEVFGDILEDFWRTFEEFGRNWFVEEKIKNFRKVENEPKTQLFVGRSGRHLVAR